MPRQRSERTNNKSFRPRRRAAKELQAIFITGMLFCLFLAHAGESLLVVDAGPTVSFVVNHSARNNKCKCTTTSPPFVMNHRRPGGQTTNSPLVLDMTTIDPMYDDDDISQHECMTNFTTTAATDANKPMTGYRRIEDWHDDHVSENPEGEQVLAHLKREQAKWASKFQSLGGEGI